MIHISLLLKDGFAFWYTKERTTDGPVFGNRDQWCGLAVIFDTIDDDAKGFAFLLFIL